MGGGKSNSTAPPPPNPSTTFDYTAANRSQMDADGKISRAQAANVTSSTMPSSFGAELGASTMQGAMG
jgi:hypothetical protein